MNIKLFGLLGIAATALFIGRLAVPAVATQREAARNTYIAPQVLARIMERIRLENQGTVYLHKHELTLAEKSFRDALEVDPRSGGAMFGLAQVLDEQGHSMEAVVIYRKVLYNHLDGAENDPGLQLRFASLLDKTGYKEEATEEYRRLVDGKEPDSGFPTLSTEDCSPSEVRALAHMARGTEIFWHGQRANGLSELQDAVKIAPSLGIVHAYYAVALSAVGKSKEAHNELSKAKGLGDSLRPFANQVR